MKGWKELRMGKQGNTRVLLYYLSLDIISLLQPFPVFLAWFLCTKQAPPGLRVLFPSYHRELSVPTFSPSEGSRIQLVWLL